MKKSKITILILFLLSLCFILSGCSLYKVVKLEKESSGTEFYFENNSFDADKYASSNWDSKVIPAVNKKAADIGQVLNAVEKNIDAAGKKFGIMQDDEGGSWNFIVKGNLKVLKVDTESRHGTIEAAIIGADKKKVTVQIGPVFYSTSIRDSLDFIKFDDFTNQMDFAGVSTALNNYVYKNVLSKLDYKKLAGKELKIVGVFTYDTPDNIVITPVVISGGGK